MAMNHEGESNMPIVPEEDVPQTETTDDTKTETVVVNVKPAAPFATRLNTHVEAFKTARNAHRSAVSAHTDAVAELEDIEEAVKVATAAVADAATDIVYAKSQAKDAARNLAAVLDEFINAE